ncbi:MAG: hypothetical protein WCY43_02425 [Patescibacteria group bacterium]|nr:hypothetical protein [Patescibacteria group bacterium]
MSDKKEKSKYLEEDSDILKELDHSYSVDATHLFRKLQIQSILRNRKSLEDSGEDTRRFSTVLSIVAIVQVLVALSQLFFSVFASEYKWLGLGLIIVLIFTVYFIIKELKNLF